MAPKKKKPPPEDGGQGEENGDEKPTLGNSNADPVRIHREYIERRMGGGREATPDAYEDAMRQWKELPGALSAPPSEVNAQDVTRALGEKQDAESAPPPDLGPEEAAP